MINFIHATSPAEGADALSKKIVSAIQDKKKVLWLICGGSNIPIAVDIMNMIREDLEINEIKNLTIMQTDERYGIVGHLDSNWQQLIDLGFKIHGLVSFPILCNLTLKETVVEYGKIVDSVFKEADVIVGQFGIGPDGHIAGIMPHSPAVTDSYPTCGYEGSPFTRLTLTPPSLEQVNVAYVFVFGSGKREAIVNLKDKDLSIDDEPAQILKKIPEVYFYSDQV